MAFEQMDTDERLENPVRRPPDLDTQMLFGCSGFVATSMASYVVSVAPHLVWTDVHRAATLAACSAAGLIPASVLGVYATRRFGLPGGAGFLGGALAFSVFLFLRIQQVMTFRHAREAPQPDYPAAWVWMAPVGWVLFAGLLIFVFLPRSEFALSEE